MNDIGRLNLLPITGHHLASIESASPKHERPAQTSRGCQEVSHIIGSRWGRTVQTLTTHMDSEPRFEHRGFEREGCLRTWPPGRRGVSGRPSADSLRPSKLAMAGRSAAVRLALVLALVLLAPLRCDGFAVPPRLGGRLQHSGRSQAGDAAASAFLRAQWPLRKSFPEGGGPLQASVELVDAKEPVESLTPTQRKFYLLINAGCIAAVLGLALSKFVLVDSELWRGWTLQEVLLRIPIDNWNEYTSVLHDRPIFVKACTSLTVYMIGDLLAQLLAGEKVEALDRSRLARSGAAGFLGHGPMSHYWYILCDGLFNKLGLTAWWSVFPKVGVDQALWGPIWNGKLAAIAGLFERAADEVRCCRGCGRGRGCGC
eukprot:scaffold7946_cov267-Pinguiococcus_pyrenoidosus.AAC.2